MYTYEALDSVVKAVEARELGTGLEIKDSSNSIMMATEVYELPADLNPC
ncbi:unnamed protein product [uncultured virus]|nr:unnamed protein product [uncultured virus]